MGMEHHIVSNIKLCLSIYFNSNKQCVSDFFVKEKHNGETVFLESLIEIYVFTEKTVEMFLLP